MKNYKAAKIDKKIGKYMRKRRLFLGKTQNTIGEHIGLTFQQIQKYEKGKNRISIGMFYLICETLDITPIEFLQEADKNQPIVTTSTPRTTIRMLELWDALSKDKRIEILSIIKTIVDK